MEANAVDPQTTYAIVRARIELRLAALREALDEHEADCANWAHSGALERVEQGLGVLVQEVAKP